MTKIRSDQRQKILAEVSRLADAAVFGTLSEQYRTCGTPGCRCHGPGPKHGPYLHVVYQGPTGKTAGYYVLDGAQAAIRDGVTAWQTLQSRLRELADLNKEAILERARAAKSQRSTNASASSPSKTGRPVMKRRQIGSGTAAGQTSRSS